MACLAAAAAPLAGQVGGVDEAHAMARFRALDPSRQVDVVHTARTLILEDVDADIQRIVRYAGSAANFPVAVPPAIEGSRGAELPPAPARRLVLAGTSWHDRLRQRYPAVVDLPDLHKEVFYDWATGNVLRREQPLTPQEQFENLMRGYPPGADAAIARILADLDTGAGQRALGEFFGREYSDADGWLYEGITLYDVWISDDPPELSPVDAAAFEIGIKLFRRSAGPGADNLNMRAEVRKQAQQYRAYRQLLAALAATFVAPAPAVDDPNGLMVGRSHYLWSLYGDDPAALTTKFSLSPKFDDLLARLDRDLRERQRAFTRREHRQARLAEMAHRVKALAVAALP